MNVNIFILSDNILMGKMPCPNEVEVTAVKKGFFVSKKLVLPSFYPDLNKVLSTDKNSINIIICEKEKARVNETIAQLTNDVIKENPSLKNAVLSYYKEVNLPPEKQALSQWEVPSKARGIISEGVLEQGYFVHGEGASFVVLSLFNFHQSLEVVLDAIQNNHFKVYTLKTFGLKEESVRQLLAEKFRNKEGVKISTFSNRLDVDVIVRGKTDNEKLEEYVSFALKKLSKFVYAEEQVSLYKVVFELLKITGKKLAVAESITGGNIASSIIKHNSGASQIIENACVVYSDMAKNKTLDVSPVMLQSKTAVSSEVAFEMAQGLLKNFENADIVLATTGYADAAKAGECFIALGDREKIHVYKNVFSGTREEIIEDVTKSALFYLVKKFRSNDFVFT